MITVQFSSEWLFCRLVFPVAASSKTACPKSKNPPGSAEWVLRKRFAIQNATRAGSAGNKPEPKSKRVRV
jgi:hypothetical protein